MVETVRFIRSLRVFAAVIVVAWSLGLPMAEGARGAPTALQDYGPVEQRLQQCLYGAGYAGNDVWARAISLAFCAGVPVWVAYDYLTGNG